MTDLRLDVTGRRPLRFDDGAPVRAASAVVRVGDGWLVAQDDATAGAWLRAAGDVTRVRLLPPVAGHDLFSEAAGTKRLKPDLEAACEVRDADGTAGALLLGSGSLPNRTAGVLVRLARDGSPQVSSRDLGALYGRVADALGVDAGQLNLEGACVVGEVLRWFHRGLPHLGVPAASVDVPVAALVAAVAGDGAVPALEVTGVRRYDLGALAGVALGVTDAVTLPDGRILVSAGAEATDDPVADGPLAGSAVALLTAEGAVAAVAPLEVAGVPLKVEGLALVEADDDGARLLAVVDQDDPTVPSLALDLDVTWR